MTATTHTPDPRRRAAELDAQLATLADELRAAANPHRAALRTLEMDALGHVKRVYHDNAFAVWLDIAREYPEDLQAVHHLALMHHARAIDQEAGWFPDRADADWQAALERWAQLWREQAFWRSLADKVYAGEPEPDREAAAERLRAELPAGVLRVHFEVAFDGATLAKTPWRGPLHVQLALASPFPDDVKARLRQEAYEAFVVRALPDEVWTSSDPAVVEAGSERLSAFLAVDPDFVQALTDLLSLQDRAVTAAFTAYQAAGSGKAEQDDEIQRLRRFAERWRTHLDRLARFIDAVDDTNRDGVRDQLCRWYWVMGMVHGRLNRDDDAIAFLDSGVRIGTPGGSDIKQCQDALVALRCRAARDAAGEADSPSEKQSARAQCDPLRRPGLPIDAACLLAQAYALLDDFATATAICHDTLAKPPSHDPDGLERVQETLARVELRRQQHQIRGRLDEAQNLIQRKQFAKAVAVLDEVIARGPQVAAYFLRCRCHLTLGAATEARRDLREFERLASTPEEHRLAAEAGEAVRELQDEIDRFGDKGRLLLSQAIQAANADRLPEAADLLQRAIAAAPRAGRAHLERQRAVVLNRWGNDELSETFDSPTSSIADKRACAQRVLLRFREAHRLDPANANIQENVRLLENMLGSP
jgi:tetratricopeptide (TPR) repeat protein